MELIVRIAHVARDQKLGHAEAGRDGAKLKLRELDCGERLLRRRELHVPPLREELQGAGLKSAFEHAAILLPVERIRPRGVLVDEEAHEHRLDLRVDEKRVFKLIKLREAEKDRREPREAAHLSGGERREEMHHVFGGTRTGGR